MVAGAKKHHEKKSNKWQEEAIKERKQFWPDISEEYLWNRKVNIGFTNIPRTMPIIMNIIDDLTNRKPAGKTYLALWVYSRDDIYVKLVNNQEQLAYHSGFSRQRALATWKQRMTSLQDLGFIKIAPGTAGKLSYALILNPYFVIRKLKNKKEPGLTDTSWNALIKRASEIGAEDMDKELPEYFEGQSTPNTAPASPIGSSADGVQA